jgi:hypothetical protein
VIRGAGDIREQEQKIALRFISQFGEETTKVEEVKNQ